MTPARLATLHALSFAATPRPWSRDEFAALLTAPGVALEVRGDGFLMWRDTGDGAEVLTLAVPPAARRRGIASALIVACAARAQVAGVDRLFLEVANSNAPARALYHAHGFAQVGTRPGYYRHVSGAPIAALVLEKRL